MKTFFLVVALLVYNLSFSIAQSSYTISGKASDVTNESLIGVNVMLLQDSSLIKASVTDITGTFLLEDIPEGKYALVLSYIGFNNYNIDTLSVDKNISLGDIILLEASTQNLQEAVVTTHKPFIEVKADKVVVNVESSITSAGSSVMDVLQKSPGVNVDNNDNISLKGKNGVIIWIDGKPTSMQGSDLATILKSMPAESVETIELISNPGAKYDAAGSAGIINIKTKRDKRLGWNGSTNLSYGQGRYPKYGAGANLNYRSKRISFYTSYNYAHRNVFNNLILERSFLDSNNKQLFKYSQDNYSTFDFRNHIANIGGDYSISAKTSIGASVGFTTNKFDPVTNNNSLALDGNNDVLYNFTTLGYNNNFYYNYSANANLRHQFDTNGRTISVDVDYAAFNSNTVQNFTTKYTAPDGSIFLPDYTLKSDLSGLTSIQSLKSDYTHPVNLTTKIEGGIKSSLAKADNEPLFFEKTNEEFVLDTKRSNHFIYNENINAGYLNFNKSWTDWSTQLGVRVENTNAVWEQKATAQKFDTSYVQLFPSLAVQYKANPKNDISLTLSRRIERPNYQQLNPFKFFIDKTTYREGYPYLIPASFYAAELTHTHNYSLVTSLLAGINRNFIAEVLQPSETEDSVTVQTNKNLKQMTFLGINGSYSSQLTKWWHNTTHYQVYYVHYTGNIANTELNRGRPTFNVYSSNTFILPHDFSTELSFYYRAREVYGYLDIRSNWMLNLGVQKHFFDKKATLKINIQDIFYRGWPRGSSEYTAYYEYFEAMRETRVASISFVYRFGNKNVQQVRKRGGGAEDEIRRANSAGTS